MEIGEMINLIINLLDDITKQAFENSSFMRELTTIICKKLGYHESVSLIDSLCSFLDDLHRTITSNGPKIVRIERTPEEIETFRDELTILLNNWCVISDGAVSPSYEKGVLKTLEWILGGELPIEPPLKTLKNKTRMNQ